MPRMTNSLIFAGTLAAMCVSYGCTANVHDNTADVHDNTVNIDDAKVSFSTSADVENVQPMKPIPCAVKAENVFLIEPTATPPADRVATAGHFQFYLDDTAGEPIMITAQETVSVTLKAETKPGPHKIICRVHKHDGTATKATFELSITVKVGT